MKIFQSLPAVLVIGFVLAGAVIAAAGANAWGLIVWLHVLAGITWIGLLYYFNFVQVQALAEAAGDSGGPGPAGISKYVAPRALWWFRWGALATWLTGAAALSVPQVGGFGLHFLAQNGVTVLGVGAWLGTIMLLNVWGLIWPNQKKVLGITAAGDEAKARAKTIALIASRTNTFLSIPMLLCMVGHGHGISF
ncbi:MAG: urate hydroxylase PuuD [Gammaproteobacteria bacterium]|nr:urate hydroxylase PuuD [Gammaproteobacteria bacterium]